jgi:hypothetical protein
LLYSSKDNKITGRLRLAKLLFIASREISSPNIEIESSEFIPYKQGPYPLDFNDIIEVAQDNRLLEVEGNQFTLTPEGIKIVEELFLSNEEGRELVNQVKQIVERFKEASDDAILAYVYLKYPGFATKSEIKRLVFLRIREGLQSFIRMARMVGITEEEINQSLENARMRTLQKLYG